MEIRVRRTFSNSSNHYSGYFIVDDEPEVETESASKTTRIPIRRENSHSRIPIRRENSQARIPLRREASQSSLYSSPQYEEGGERSRTLPRQASRSRVARQESRGSVRRQQSTSRLTTRKDSACQEGAEVRDVYSGNKNIWQNSLRGAGRTEGENSRGRSRQNRSNLEPAGGRSVVSTPSSYSLGTN